MQILIYVIEWVISFFVIWGIFYLSVFLFRRKFNPITSVVLSFIIIGFFVFLIAPYLISFPKPSYIYTPFLIFWLIYFLYKANKEVSSL